MEILSIYMLQNAIELRDLEKVKQIIAEDQIAIEGTTLDGVPLALHAARMGNVSIVKYIVAKQAAASLDHKSQNARVLAVKLKVARIPQACTVTKIHDFQSPQIGSTEAFHRSYSPFPNDSYLQYMPKCKFLGCPQKVFHSKSKTVLCPRHPQAQHKPIKDS